MEPGTALEIHQVSVTTLAGFVVFFLTGFGALVMWGVSVIRGEVKKIGERQVDTNNALHAHINLSEKRFSTLEAEWRIFSRVSHCTFAAGHGGPYTGGPFVPKITPGESD